jgi:hypothetical protein
MDVLGRRKRRRAFRAARFISADASLKLACSGIPNRMARLILALFFAHGDVRLSVTPDTAPRVPTAPAAASAFWIALNRVLFREISLTPLSTDGPADRLAD